MRLPCIVLSLLAFACSSGPPDGFESRPPALSRGGDWLTIAVVDNPVTVNNDTVLMGWDLQATAAGRVALTHRSRITSRTPAYDPWPGTEDWFDADGRNAVRYGSVADLLFGHADIRHGFDDYRIAGGRPDVRWFRASDGEYGTVNLTDETIDLWPTDHVFRLWPAPASVDALAWSWHGRADRGVLSIDLFANEGPGGVLPEGYPPVAPFVFRYDLATRATALHSTPYLFHQQWSHFVIDGAQGRVGDPRMVGASWVDEPIIATAVARPSENTQLTAWHFSEAPHPGSPRVQADYSSLKLLDVGASVMVEGSAYNTQFHEVPGGIEVWRYVTDTVQRYAYDAAARAWSAPEVIPSATGGEMGQAARLADGSLVYALAVDGKPTVRLFRGGAWATIFDGSELADERAVLLGVRTGGDRIFLVLARDTFTTNTELTPAITYQGYALDVAVYQPRGE